MSKPDITITISGPAGSGKSTLAKYLAGKLSVICDLDVTLVDDGQQQALPSSSSHLPNYFDADVTINVEQK